MGTADAQGSLWGAQARDYAGIVEEFFRPVYEKVLTEAGVGPGVRFLDVGCGPGLAAQIAAQWGAQVSGLDAAAASLRIARKRTPHGDFRLGDMEELPWPDAAFDVVTGFNAFQFAGSLANALREARRVLSPEGRVAVVVWGPAKELELTATVEAIFRLLPILPPRNDASPDLAAPGCLKERLEQAGLTLLSSGEMDCCFVFPDLTTAVRGYMSVAPAVAAVQRLGEAPVQRAIADSLTRFRSSNGSYRQTNQLRWVIASHCSHSEMHPAPVLT
jgi:SAM-dependent methyltransferase